MGFGTRNAEGERILKFGDAVGTVVCNKLNTYQYGDNRSMIDYLMVRESDRCLVHDVKVISSEECIPQHRMVIGRLVLHMLNCSLMKWQLEMMKLLMLMTSKRSGY